MYGTDVVFGARHATLYRLASCHLLDVAMEENWIASTRVFIYRNHRCQFRHFRRVRFDAYGYAHPDVNNRILFH